MKKWFLIGAILFFLAGFFLVMSSKPIGVVLMVAGIGLGVVYAAVMLRRGGYCGDGAFHHGLAGQGRQQSEVVKRDEPSMGEQSAKIWETLTENKDNK